MKEVKTIISKVGLISLTALTTLFVSCSKNDDFPEPQDNPAGVEIGGVSGYVTHFDEPDMQTRSGDALTRAWEIPLGFMAYEDGDQPIAIAFTQDGSEPKMGNFFKSSGKWRTNLSEIAAGNYYLYGYIPNMAGIKYGITDYDGGADDANKNASYSMGAIMTLGDVPSVMPNDLCVVIGAKDGRDAEHDNSLRQGDFTYNAKAISDGNDGGNFVFLLFDHLYAALRIRMKVDANYAALRTIKLKSLQLSTQAGETTTKQKTNITISLQAKDDSTSPITGITYTYTPTGAAISGGIEFWSSTAGVALTTDYYQTFVGHFMPNGVTKLILTSVYDVYDNNVTTEHPKGNLIRKNCKATNTMVLKDVFSGQTETQRGKRYTINMTIQPTYLYMLSEPDLDNPELRIEN